jgi:hypothetical protein
MATQAITDLKFEIHGHPFFVTCLQLSARSASLTGRTKGFRSTISQGLRESFRKLFDE